MARKCSAQGLKESKQAQFLPVSQAYLKEQSKRQDQAEEICPEVFPNEGWKPEEDVELIPLDPDQPDKKVRISSRLSPDEKVELTTFLKNNKDMFPWSSSNMPAEETQLRTRATAGFIKEVSYSEWLANIVLVAKQEKGKWRVCIDYTDLNKACPKDNFQLPIIDQLMDSTSGNQLLNFMDAYSGYNQILMHERGTYY
ncbi:unnamed protein product [Prunus armeniaca]